MGTGSFLGSADCFGQSLTQCPFFFFFFFSVSTLIFVQRVSLSVFIYLWSSVTQVSYLSRSCLSFLPYHCGQNFSQISLLSTILLVLSFFYLPPLPSLASLS